MNALVSMPISSDFILRDHDSVGVSVNLADLDLDMLIIESFQELLTNTIFGSLFVSYSFPLIQSQVQVLKYWSGKLTSSAIVFSSWPFSTPCKNPRSVLLWNKQITHLPFSMAANAS